MKGSEIIKSVASAAGLGLVAWGISQLMEIWGVTKIFGFALLWISRKLMKAPGGNYYIFRDVFERDPAGYFRGLRNLKN